MLAAQNYEKEKYDNHFLKYEDFLVHDMNSAQINTRKFLACIILCRK